MKRVKKIAALLMTAVLLTVSLSAYATTVEEAQSKLWSTYTAALESEKAGQYDQAREAYNNFIHYATILQNEAGQDHWENIKGFSALVNHLEDTPELYVEATLPADVPYYGAKHEPVQGTFFGKSDEFAAGKESAYLLYVTFKNEEISSFEYLLPEQKGIYLEVAWNVANENKASLDEINSGSCDSYIISNLQYLNTLDYKVLLRFGAEVNCWVLPETEPELSAFIESYKSAFRRIADYARQYASNVAMVYSPNDVSNWLVTVEDFYPGDAYVDWVGLSMYNNLNSAARFEHANSHDAYYCLGYYDNPIVKIKNVVDAFGDRKPIMISECGFSYGGDGLQTEDRAVTQLKKFYTYVNMVYPQVKGIMYFNTNLDGKYELTDSARMWEAYNQVTAANPAIEGLSSGRQKSYTRFTTINEHTDTLKLALYAEFPSGIQSDVSYTLDGVGLVHSGTFPYTASIAVTSLAEGRHVLTVGISNGSYYSTRDYEFFVGPDNFVTNSAAAMQYAYDSRPNITVTLNGNAISFPQQPILYADNTLVPLRAIFEALQAEVVWEEATQSITATKGSTVIRLQIDNINMTVNGVTKTLNVPAKLIKGTTLVPVRAISEAFNCGVTWDGATQTVIING